MDTPANIPQRVVYEISADDLQATIEAAVVRGMEAVEAKHRLPTYLDRDKVCLTFVANVERLTGVEASKKGGILRRHNGSLYDG